MFTTLTSSFVTPPTYPLNSDMSAKRLRNEQEHSRKDIENHVFTGKHGLDNQY